MHCASPLSGIRVVDLCDLPGAYLGKLLADMGAEVVLVEPPDGSEVRRHGPFRTGSEPGTQLSLLFAYYNSGKRSVALDLETAPARAQLHRLIASSDVVLETLAPDDLANYRLDYPHLAATNPRLVWVSISPFGRQGPYRHYRGSDLVCQALGGMIYLNGDPGEAPLPCAGLQAYHCAALHAAVDTLATLLGRTSSGGGRFIDVSVQECACACVEHAVTLFRRERSVAQRQGGLHWTGDFQVVRSADSYLMMSHLGDWTTLAEWVCDGDRRFDLADQRWTDAEYRRANAGQLFGQLSRWAAGRAADEIVAAAQNRRLPVTPVRSIAEVVDNPQLRARGFFQPLAHDGFAEPLVYPGAPYVFSRSPWRLRRAPLLDEHNAEISSQLDARRSPQPAPRAAAEVRSAPLSGLRVLDFTWAVGGPIATRTLADLGADVIKIERPGSAPGRRRRRSRHGALNRGKRSIAIDLSQAAGRDLVRRLVATTDVVVESFSPRVMSNWGIDYRNLSRIRPDIIYVSMSAFGHSGPHRDHVAYGPNLQAVAGFNALMRDSSGVPVGMSFAYSDMVAGWSAAVAVLLAVCHRRASGEGQHVDLSQFENLVALLGPHLLALLNPETASNAGDLVKGSPIDNLLAKVRSAPYGVFRCANDPTQDGGPAGTEEAWCAIDIDAELDWERFCRLLGNPTWTRDGRFASPASRVRHQREMHPHLEEWTQQRRAVEVMKMFQEAGLAAGVVATAADLCGRDPQLEWRRRHLHSQRPSIASPPLGLGEFMEPALGEHTEAVLAAILEIPADRIAALRQAGIIG